MLGFLEKNCTLRVLSSELIGQLPSFSCGHADLDDFFINESNNYHRELLGKSYCFCLDNHPNTIVCAFTISNSDIDVKSLPTSRKSKVIKKIPREKHMRNYPAVLIGRLGVNKDFKGRGIGTELMNFIKMWFIDPNNKTGCRFIVVDSYNEKESLGYYEKNEFSYLFSSEEQEKDILGLKETDKLKTKFMYFDLILLSKNA